MVLTIGPDHVNGTYDCINKFRIHDLLRPTIPHGKRRRDHTPMDIFHVFPRLHTLLGCVLTSLV